MTVKLMKPVHVLSICEMINTMLVEQGETPIDPTDVEYSEVEHFFVTEGGETKVILTEDFDSSTMTAICPGVTKEDLEAMSEGLPSGAIAIALPKWFIVKFLATFNLSGISHDYEVEE